MNAIPRARALFLLIAGAVLLALYVRGAWPLGFVLLLPWLLRLESVRGLGASLRVGWLLSLLFTLAGFHWFGVAIGRFSELGPWVGLGLLLLGAPLFQPQILAWVLVRQFVRARQGALWGALAASAAWVGAEWLLPKLLGDSLGHGLYPSALLRQGAALGGVAGLTLLLLLTNEALAAALTQRAWRVLGLAAVPPLLLAGYGLGLQPVPAEAPQLRVGLIQANLSDLELRRKTQGSHAVVAELLDLHYAMSHDAVERQQADAVLWSETVYPTTFAQPKSEAGAAFDREIVAIVQAAGVPFVFGTYDRDGAGEYNAAAFVEPGRGLLGFYRKTRLFPLTESVPAWLDGPTLRRWLPWAGRWQAGDGARVLPLHLRDGRELPVQPLICRDDVDPMLAIAGARLGAQALLTMSNDSWFSQDPLGAELHQAVAAFRSIETRLPQFRVTTNGFSALIDAFGTVRASARMNERSLVIDALPVPVPPPTVMVRWGDWVGPCALVGLGLFGLVLAWPRGRSAAPLDPTLPATVAVLPSWARWTAAGLRAAARIGLLGLGLALLLDESLRTQTLQQLRGFAGGVLLPEALAACVLAAYRARLTLEPGRLLLLRGAQRLELPLATLVAVDPWRLPLPARGALLRLRDGRQWALGGVDPDRLAHALQAAGGPAAPAAPAYAAARGAVASGRWSRPLPKFLLLPLLLAVPAFVLHQRIAYGGWLGEYYSHGPGAYLLAFGLWWASWALGVLLCAAALRMGIEAGSLLAARLRPASALPVRRGLERGGLALLWLGLPLGWLARVLG